MQTFPEKYQSGAWAAAVDIVASEGLGFLLAGLGTTKAEVDCRSMFNISAVFSVHYVLLLHLNATARANCFWIWYRRRIEVWILRSSNKDSSQSQ